MRVTVFGIGYVGLVTGTCLAEAGNEDVCIEVDQARVEVQSRGEILMYAPGVEPVVRGNHRAGRLHFAADPASGVAHSEIIFIAVGTPPDEDSSADMRYVL